MQDLKATSTLIYLIAFSRLVYNYELCIAYLTDLLMRFKKGSKAPAPTIAAPRTPNTANKPTGRPKNCLSILLNVAFLLMNLLKPKKY